MGKRESVWIPKFRQWRVDGLCECESAQRTAFVIPITCGAKFRASVRVKRNSHSDSPNNSARTSSHGINCTVPASISDKRRSISADHAASTSGSGSDTRSTVAPGYSIKSSACQFIIADGLGCSFVRGLVHLHGWKIRGGSRIDSKVLRGLSRWSR